mgnify:FL=1
METPPGEEANLLGGDLDTIQRLRDRELLLEEALHNAQWTIKYLHGCLTDKVRYKYQHPDQTIKMLGELKALAPPPMLCRHSGFEPNCTPCADRVARGNLLAAARERVSKR